MAAAWLRCTGTCGLASPAGCTTAPMYGAQAQRAAKPTLEALRFPGCSATPKPGKAKSLVHARSPSRPDECTTVNDSPAADAPGMDRPTEVARASFTLVGPRWQALYTAGHEPGLRVRQ